MNLTREQSRQVDRLAMDRYGIPGIVLMENAGIQAARILCGCTPNRFLWITVCCGKGNNGGDGFVIARQMLTLKYTVRVWLFADPESLTGDAAVQYKILHNLIDCEGNLPPGQEAKLKVERFSPDRKEELKKDFTRSSWTVDALLGTGATGPPKGDILQGIKHINAQKRRSFGSRVFAIDVPSGLDCDTGLPNEPTVRADETCTFVAAKTGFSAEEAKPYLGNVHVANIGIPSEMFINEVRIP